MAQQVKNPTGIQEDVGLIPVLAQWVKDLALLWLCHRPAVAAPNRPVAQELPYAAVPKNKVIIIKKIREFL